MDISTEAIEEWNPPSWKERNEKKKKQELILSLRKIKMSVVMKRGKEDEYKNIEDLWATQVLNKNDQQIVLY